MRSRANTLMGSRMARGEFNASKKQTELKVAFINSLSRCCVCSSFLYANGIDLANLEEILKNAEQVGGNRTSFR